MILHNVRDGRNGGNWGSWEVEPLDYDKLDAEHVGRTMIYRDYGSRCEAGTISSWRDGIVFARYSRGDTAAGAQATGPNKADLFLVLRQLQLDNGPPR